MTAASLPARAACGPFLCALAVSALVLFFAGPAQGQIAPAGPAAAPQEVPAVTPLEKTHVALSLGGGSGLAAELAVIRPLGPGTLVGRLAGTHEVPDLSFNSYNDGEDETVELAALYGLATGSEKAWLQGALGLGVARIQRFESGPYTCSTTQWSRSCGADTTEIREVAVGLAFRVDGVLALGPSFGLGVATFGNVNDKDSFAAVALSLDFW